MEMWTHGNYYLYRPSTQTSSENDIRFVKGDSTTNTIHVTFWSGRKAKYKCDDRIYYIAAYERLRRNIQYPF